jgi:hypothetical protein
MEATAVKTPRLSDREKAAIKRAGGLCEFQTQGCSGTATTVIVDAGYWIWGRREAPAHALKAACAACSRRWAR